MEGRRRGRFLLAGPGPLRYKGGGGSYPREGLSMSEESSFRGLLDRVRAGDERAAEELIRTYLRHIRLVVRKRLRDPALRPLLESMDICQSILGSFFLRVALGQFDLQTPEDLRKLLVTMALNKIRNHKRKLETSRRDHRRNRSPAAGVEFIDPAPSPGRVVANRELLQEVRRRLSDEVRLLVDLRADGYTWPEIAARLGEPPDTLRLRHDRAVDRLAEELGLHE